MREREKCYFALKNGAVNAKFREGLPARFVTAFCFQDLDAFCLSAEVYYVQSNRLALYLLIYCEMKKNESRLFCMLDRD